MLAREDERLAGSPLGEIAETASTCTLCGLSEGRKNVVFGMGDPHADLMFVGEGPGEHEDEQGLPFVGRSGKLLDKLMAQELGLERSQVYITNVVKCRPPGNRDPRSEEIAACRPYLKRQLELIVPKVIVSLGNPAAQTLLGTRVGISKLRGRRYRFGEAVLVPTYHPAALLRGGAEMLPQARADFVLAKLSLRG